MGKEATSAKKKNLTKGERLSDANRKTNPGLVEILAGGVGETRGTKGIQLLKYRGKRESRMRP